MNRKVRLVLLISILIGLLLYIIPVVLVKDFIKRQLINYTNGDKDSKIEIGQVDWKWYPVPHIVLNKISYNRINEISIFSNQIELIPSFTTLFYLNIKFDAIINDIEIQINQLKEKDSNKDNDKVNLKKINWLNRLIVKNGKITFISQNIKGFEFNDLVLSNVNLNIDIDFDKINTVSSFDTNFSKKNNLNIEYNLLNNDIVILLKTQELNVSLLNKYVPKEYKLKIKESSLTGEIKITIDKEKNIEIFSNLFNSKLILIKDENNIKDFIIRNISFSTNLNKLDTKIQLKKLILTKPDIKITGYINVKKENDGIPLWDIDLSSEYAEITTLREYIKDIFNESRQPDRLFKYVHSGKAYNSRFKYNGKTKYPLDSEIMYYEGRIENSKIYIPLLDYFIDDLSANVKLDNGLLKLENILASQNENKCYGGSFLISVDEKDFFSINLELLMELNTIKRLLYELYHRPYVRAELDRFSNLSGFVKGNLIIGDKLSDIHTNIIINQINVSFNYNRVPWEVSINDGNIKISNHGIDLNSVSLNLEKNKIEQLTGKLNFSDQYDFKFNALKITLDSNSFLSRIPKVIDINKTLFRLIDSINGEITLSNTEISGNFFDPFSWKYNSTITAKKTNLETKLFFSHLHIENTNLVINNNTIDIKNLQFFSSLDKNKITVSGRLNNPIINNKIDNFDLTINGTLSLHYYNWLSSLGVLNKDFYPKFPININNFKISKNLGEFRIIGDLRPANTNYLININILTNEDLLNVEKLNFYRKNDLITSISFKKKNDEVLFLNFSGKIDKSILDEILMENNILNGQIYGNIKFSFNKINSQENYCTGDINLNSLIITDNNHKIQILNSTIKGHNDAIELKNATIVFNNETLQYNGTLHLRSEHKKLKLDLYSDYLSEKNIDHFFSNDNNGYLKKLNIEPEIQFNIKNFLLTKNNRQNDNSQLIIKELKGKYTSSQDKSYIEIQHGNLCGMRLNGTIRRNITDKASYFNLIIDKDDQKSFQDFLPCIGFNNTDIEGKFSMNLNITKKNDNYESGHLYLYSDNGKINRFTLLSKVLTLLNVTYLLENLPDIFKTGLNYKHLEIDGSISDNIFYLNKSIIKGSGMNLISQGSVDLKTMEVDLVVLVTPLKTLDAILKNLPLVGKILGGNNGAILTYPVGVKGPINDPKINTLPPESLGEAITTLLTETLRLPFKIISPIFKGDTEKKQ